MVRNGRPASKAGAVIDRPSGEIPAVEMSANEQDRRLGVAAANFGDDIA
jgi:hypothetical protein